MNAEYPILDHDREGQKVEHVRKIRPYVWTTVFPNAFGVKPVGLDEEEQNAYATRRVRMIFFLLSDENRIHLFFQAEYFTNLRHSSGFMISSYELYSIRVSQLETRQK